MIERVEQHVVYENPRPQVHSRHGYFPGLTQLPDGELLCLFVIGEAFESPDSTTWVARSRDEGRTWTLQGVLNPKEAGGLETSDYWKPTLLRDGSLVAIGYRFHRHDPEAPISLPETGGILPGDDLIAFSRDGGRTWSDPDIIERSYPELLELSGPCIELRSGALLAGGAPYTRPDGSSPSCHFGAQWRSGDKGRTWDDRMRYFEMPGRPVQPFEGRICEMQDNRLVAIVWAYDAERGEHLNNHVVTSHDGGASWSAPIDTGHRGQASNFPLARRRDTVDHSRPPGQRSRNFRTSGELRQR